MTHAHDAPLPADAALSALLRNPEIPILAVVLDGLRCSICDTPIAAGPAWISVWGEDGCGQACHRSCWAVADDAGWESWTTGDTLREHLPDRADDGDAMVMVPERLRDEWRGVLRAMRVLR